MLIETVMVRDVFNDIGGGADDDYTNDHSMTVKIPIIHVKCNYTFHKTREHEACSYVLACRKKEKEVGNVIHEIQ